MGWLGKVEQSIRQKKPFNDIADQCTQFYSAATSFMWEPQYQKKFIGPGKSLNPRFRMTMAKAFEFVALVGPYLYWKNPQRAIKPRDLLQLDPAYFGVTPALQQPQQMPGFPGMGMPGMGFPGQNQMLLFQQMQQQQQEMEMGHRVRCQLAEKWLNYTPYVTPGGGLATQSSMGITEAMVTGRGLAWPEQFKLPGSDRILTGCFHDSVDNFFFDPDCLDPTLDEATWICRRCVHPIRDVEREYRLPEGTLAGKGNLESANQQGGMRANDLENVHRAQGKTHDLLVYYKIWSKRGVGVRQRDVETPIERHLEDVVGDYAYIVVAPNVPFPLNAWSERVKTAMDEDVGRMFSWPIPYWTKGDWPVSILDFYRKRKSPYPIAPLGPGLGELTFMNIMIAHLSNRIWTSMRDIICVLKSAAGEIDKAIKSGEDQEVVHLGEIHKDIRQVVSVLQMPQTNLDAWKIFEAVSEIFDKRVGLSEVLYAMNAGGVASRTAEDSRNKQKASTLRIDKMAADVAAWQADMADKEKYLMRMVVNPQHTTQLIGPAGAYLWDKFIHQQDPSLVIDEMDCTVMANTLRKPDKDRDRENAQALVQFAGPIVQAYAHDTSDTKPINGIIQQWGEANETDVSGIMLGPWHQPPPPPPDPQQVAMQQQEMQLQQQKLQADITLVQAKAQHAHEQAVLDHAASMQAIQHTQAEHVQGVVHADREQQQAMTHAEMNARQKMILNAMAARASAKAKASNGKQKTGAA